jgi:hypothetical protein
MSTNVDNLEAVAQLLEQAALETERAGRPFQWSPWATVRDAAQELVQLRANHTTTSKWFDDAVQELAALRDEVADLGVKLAHARDRHAWWQANAEAIAKERGELFRAGEAMAQELFRVARGPDERIAWDAAAQPVRDMIANLTPKA